MRWRGGGSVQGRAHGEFSAHGRAVRDGAAKQRGGARRGHEVDDGDAAATREEDIRTRKDGAAINVAADEDGGPASCDGYATTNRGERAAAVRGDARATGDSHGLHGDARAQDE